MGSAREEKIKQCDGKRIRKKEKGKRIKQS